MSSLSSLCAVGKAVHCLWWAWMLTFGLSGGLCNPSESSQEGQRVLVPPQTLCWWKLHPTPSHPPPSVSLSVSVRHKHTNQRKKQNLVTMWARGWENISGLTVFGHLFIWRYWAANIGSTHKKTHTEHVFQQLIPIKGAYQNKWFILHIVKWIKSEFIYIHFKKWSPLHFYTVINGVCLLWVSRCGFQDLSCWGKFMHFPMLCGSRHDHWQMGLMLITWDITCC